MNIKNLTFENVKTFAKTLGCKLEVTPAGLQLLSENEKTLRKDKGITVCVTFSNLESVVDYLNRNCQSGDLFENPFG